MTNFVVVLPLTVIILAAIVAHSSSREYWCACRNVTLFTIVVFFAYLTVLDEFQIQIFFVSGISGVVAFLLAATVGIPFVLDRQVQAREKAREEKEL